MDKITNFVVKQIINRILAMIGHLLDPKKSSFINTIAVALVGGIGHFIPMSAENSTLFTVTIIAWITTILTRLLKAAATANT